MTLRHAAAGCLPELATVSVVPTYNFIHRVLPGAATVSGVLAALPQWGVDPDAVDFAYGCMLPPINGSRCLVLNFTR